MEKARAFLAVSAAVVLVFASFGAEGTLSDAEVWNEGVEYYRAGDFTNAVRVLRPLMLSKTHGPRAAEVVAAISYAQARGEGVADSAAGAGAGALESLELAAAAAQLALRSSPDDQRLRRNFARATDSLPSLRETKHLNDLLAAAQNSSPEAMVAGAIQESRSLMDAAASYRTNAAPVAVALADSLSARAERLADRWTVLREAVAHSVTNEEEAATIMARVDESQKLAKTAAKALADFTGEAYSPLAQTEQDFYAFYKRVAGCSAAIREDLTAQSNAWQDVEAFNSREWQPEALDWTRVFRMRFPEWAQQYEQRAQSDTNLPPFTAEAQAEISALSTQLEKIQLECVKDILPPKQEEAVGIIQRIMELLPPEQGGGAGQASQQQNGGNKQQNQKPDKSDKGENGDEQQSDDQNAGTQEEQPDDAAGEEEKEAAEAEESDEEPPKDAKEVEAILKKAQERSDEHEADKKARMRKAPLPPNERDW